MMYICNVMERRTNKLIATIQTKSIIRLRKFMNKYGYNDTKKYYYKFKDGIEKNEI